MTPLSAVILSLSAACTGSIDSGAGSAEGAVADGGVEPDGDIGSLPPAEDDGWDGGFEDPEPPIDDAALRGDDGLLPEAPSVPWDVALIRDNAYTRPHVPAFRTSADGRIGIQILAPGRLHLLSPERVDGPFAQSPNGAQILAPGAPHSITREQLIGTGRGKLGHLTLCDPTTAFPTATSRTNPYPCGDGLRDDCYDLVVMSAAEYGTAPYERLQIASRPIHVRVSEPKTPRARIAELRVTGSVRRGPEQPFRRFLEPMITSDGRLLVMRTGRSAFSWRNEARDRRRVTGRFNMVYSYNSGTPCDPAGWVRWRPIAHAQYDPVINGRTPGGASYGFARQHWRDSANNRIPDEVDLPGSYPWIDRAGRNLFFFASEERLFNPDPSTRDTNDVVSRYRTRCVDGVACIESPSASQIGSFEDPDRGTRGLSVLGLWTNWKMVTLDGLSNNTDYGLGHWDAAHRMVELYQGEHGWVRVGTGRSNAPRRTEPVPAGFTHNTELVDSFENLLVHAPAFQPHTPRDVVWLMNTGKVTEELAFDDYLSQRALIVAEMQVGFQTVLTSDRYLYRVRDGYVINSSRTPSFRETVLLQNAATTFPGQLPIPRHGVLVGPGRVEPVALGGVHGKGVWLRGESGVRFTLEADPAPAYASATWYAGTFLDPRFDDDGVAREIITFPDGSGLLLVGLSQIRVRGADGAVVADVPIPERLRSAYGRWMHLAVTAEEAGRLVRVFLDGFELGAVASPAAIFRVTRGDVWLGDSPRAGAGGARGWYDEFKVFAERPTDEVVCNHARGTLVALDDRAVGRWHARAHAYPLAAHERLAAALGEPATTRYACVTDYTRELGASTHWLPEGTRSVRARLLFPEGPLVFDLPRPDSTDNAFCTSCHAYGRFFGLGMDALELSPGVTTQDDLRRQPMQNLRVIYGNVTPESLAPFGPAETIRPDRTGVLIDRFLHP